jgi:hypothetical protein
MFQSLGCCDSPFFQYTKPCCVTARPCLEKLSRTKSGMSSSSWLLDSLSSLVSFDPSDRFSSLCCNDAGLLSEESRLRASPAKNGVGAIVNLLWNNDELDLGNLLEQGGTTYAIKDCFDLVVSRQSILTITYDCVPDRQHNHNSLI